MYVHQHQLEHVLRPTDYTDEGVYRSEVERLFLPAWHAVAVRSELQREGDFRTLNLLGRPVILHHSGGQIRAFENICAHRHCLLTGDPCGRMPKLRCQYHGWEYDAKGRTNKIPDAKCFRPFDRENAHLNVLRCESAGELIFVSLDDDAPPLAKSLGPFADFCRESYGGPFRFAWKWEVEYPANWKIPVENTLEAYHLPALHANSLGDHPTEEDTRHVLKPDHSILIAREPAGYAQRIQNWMVRRLGGTTTNLYTHQFLYPNLALIGMDVFRAVQVFLPTSVNTCLHRIFAYTLRGDRRGPVAWLTHRALRSVVVDLMRRAAVEDRKVFGCQQQGIGASRHPGVLGSLEERVFAFQQYVREATGRRDADLPIE